MIDELLIVAPPPSGRSTQTQDWAEVESRLGTRLPDDYKAIIDTYGPGIFGGFIHVYQPHHWLDAIDLDHQIAAAAWALDCLREVGAAIPYELGPPSELTAAGRTDNGDVFYWVRRPLDNPNLWPIAVNESRGDMWEEVAGGLSKFLAGVLSGRIKLEIFPDIFPPPSPAFEPY